MNAIKQLVFNSFKEEVEDVQLMVEGCCCSVDIVEYYSERWRNCFPALHGYWRSVVGNPYADHFAAIPTWLEKAHQCDINKCDDQALTEMAEKLIDEMSVRLDKEAQRNFLSQIINQVAPELKTRSDINFE